MVLAAGRGERLRPLTDRIPKPLITIAGVPLIDRILYRLARAGIRECVVNVAHFGHLIEAHLGDGRRYGLRVRISREPAGALETGGGIRYALSYLQSAPFLVVNADIYTEFDFSTLTLTANVLAHLVLVPNPSHNQRGDFSLREGWISNDENSRLTFSGIGVYSPALFKDTRPGDRFPLAPLLRAAADNKCVSGSFYRGIWRDIGTVARLEAVRKISHESI